MGSMEIMSYPTDFLGHFDFTVELALCASYDAPYHGYLYRSQVEERFMLAEMGEDYSNYPARTKWLIPMIY